MRIRSDFFDLPSRFPSARVATKTRASRSPRTRSGTDFRRWSIERRPRPFHFSGDEMEHRFIHLYMVAWWIPSLTAAVAGDSEVETALASSSLRNSCLTGSAKSSVRKISIVDIINHHFSDNSSASSASLRGLQISSVPLVSGHPKADIYCMHSFFL